MKGLQVPRAFAANESGCAASRTRVATRARVPTRAEKRAHPLFGPFWAPTSDPVGRVAVADVGGNDVVG